MQVQPAADLADGGLDEVKVLSVAEPAFEPVGDLLSAGPLPQARGQQRAEPGPGGERAAELSEVLGGKALKQRTGPGELRHHAGRAVAVGCGHESVVRAGQRRRIG